MTRAGYLGNAILRPGDTPFLTAGHLRVSAIPRATGLSSHVANMKRQNIVLDAAVLVARRHGFLPQGTVVGLSGARDQHFGATGGQHAAHAVKRYTFGNENTDIVALYERHGVDEMIVLGLRTMLGLVTDVDRRANLSIDKRLETNPVRVAQLQHAANHAMARTFELNRRFFEQALLRSLQGGFGGDARYGQMLGDYEAILSAPPPADEAPDAMVDMIERLVA